MQIEDGDSDDELLDTLIPMLTDPEDSCVHNFAPLLAWVREREARAANAAEDAIRERVEAALERKSGQWQSWTAHVSNIRAALQPGDRAERVAGEGGQ